MQTIHALVALPLDAGIICTSDLWEIQNTLLIICDSLRSSSHDIVGIFCQPRVISGVFYVLTPQSLSIAAIMLYSVVVGSDGHGNLADAMIV